MLNRLNLQLFAEDMEDDDLLIEDDTADIEDEEVIEDEELEELEDEELEDEEGPEIDKKTKAIIRYKKEAQEYKKRLQELEEQAEQAELEKKNNKRVEELQRKGHSLDDAKSIAGKEMEHEKLKSKIAYMELEKLETKYPGITRYSRQLAQDKEALADFSYEQIYLAKYYKQSGYDTKTQMEQELIHKAKKNKQASLEPSNAKTRQAIKLSVEDERVYRIMKQTNPKLTKKRFLELTMENE